MSITTTKSKGSNRETCAKVPEFERLNYFYGQMLSGGDFKTEQDYFREKLKLHNRCLHGYGVVCGLEIEPIPPKEECEPEMDKECNEIEKKLRQCEKNIEKVYQYIEYAKEKKQKDTIEKYQLEYKDLEAERENLQYQLDKFPPRKHSYDESLAKVIVKCGLALDCEGNELVVREPICVDLWKHLSDSEKRHIEEYAKKDRKTAVYLSLCYCAQPIDPMRPVLPDSCGASSQCNYGKTRDAVRVEVTLEKPPEDLRCDPCCQPCEYTCVTLACIYLDACTPIEAEDINNGVRRSVSLFTYSPTVITGISWKHGWTYTSEEAKKVLGTDDKNGGIEVQFSRKVLTETITEGVIDLWVIEGGSGRAAGIYHTAGELVQPAGGDKTLGFKYRQTTGETLQSGDRVLIIVRTNFILDECCQPVDGVHVGGRVPQLPDYQATCGPEEESGPECVCETPPRGVAPWTSGNGIPGGDFESWFYIE